MDYGNAISRPFKDIKRTLRIFFILSLILLPAQIFNVVLQVLDMVGEFLPDNDSVMIAYLLLYLIYIPIAIVTGWVTMGYLWRATKNVLTNDYTIPDLKNFGQIFLKGIKLWVVGFLWGLIFIVIILVLAGLVGLAYLVSKVLMVVVLVFVILIGVILLLVFAYIAPLLYINTIAEDSVGAGFSLREMAGVAFTTDYFVTFLLSIVVGIIGGLISIVGMIVLLITLVGWIFWLSIASVAIQVVVFTLYADAYKEVLAKRQGKLPGGAPVAPSSPPPPARTKPAPPMPRGRALRA